MLCTSRVGLEGKYQRAISGMGRATLGVFRWTPLGIVAAQSGLTPARAFLDHRQVRFTQRLYARPKDGFTSCRAPVVEDKGRHVGAGAPSVRLLWKEKATEAVLDFLRDTRVGCMVTLRPTTLDCICFGIFFCSFFLSFLIRRALL